MKVVINTDESAKDLEVAITCKKLTPEIEKIIAMLRMIEMQLTGTCKGETYIIDIDQIFYIETVDKRTFLYTKDKVYESNLRLYELEEQLEKWSFFRASKSCIINFRCIRSIKADIDRKLQVTLSNGERLIVSRQYSEYIKERLGVK